MRGASIDFNHVWKKFKKGERYDSLRDLIPSLVKGLVSRDARELGEREFWAIREVSFGVNRGEAVGLIGPNGAGKSTILKMISGILRPNKGEIDVTGRLSALIEVGAGFHPDLTGRENIYLNGSILGMTRREIDGRLDEIIEFSGVGDFIDTPVKRYSGGMYSRLGFAVAAHVNPEILLVDEVLSVGDALFRMKCARRMAELVKSEVTVVCVSHNIELIRQLCSKCLVLAEGRLEFFGPVDRAIEIYLQVLHRRTTTHRQIILGRPELGRIREVRITARDGRPTGQLEAGDAASVIVEYELRERVQNPALAVMLALPTGLTVTSCNTLRDGVKLDEAPGRYTARLDIDRANLAPNDYSLAVRLMAMEQWKDSTIDVYFGHLIVKGEVQGDSLISVAHEWTWR